MKKLYTSIYNHRKKSFLSKNEREKRFANYNKANTILILFESDKDENNSFIKTIIENLKSEKKTVFAIGFVNKKEVTSRESIHYILFNNKNCDWTKKPEEDILQKLYLNKYDLLINLTLTDNIIPLNYLLLYSDAACKAGIARNNEELLDFAIQVPVKDEEKEIEKEENKANSSSENTVIDEKYIFENIIFYLKSIQTTD